MNGFSELLSLNKVEDNLVENIRLGHCGLMTGTMDCSEHKVAVATHDLIVATNLVPHEVLLPGLSNG